MATLIGVIRAKRVTKKEAPDLQKLDTPRRKLVDRPAFVPHEPQINEMPVYPRPLPSVAPPLSHQQPPGTHPTLPINVSTLSGVRFQAVLSLSLRFTSPLGYQSSRRLKASIADPRLLVFPTLIE